MFHETNSKLEEELKEQLERQKKKVMREIVSMRLTWMIIPRGIIQYFYFRRRLSRHTF